MLLECVSVLLDCVSVLLRLFDPLSLMNISVDQLLWAEAWFHLTCLLS